MIFHRKGKTQVSPDDNGKKMFWLNYGAKVVLQSCHVEFYAWLVQ